jgi:hypothetical protein
MMTGRTFQVVLLRCSLCVALFSAVLTPVFATSYVSNAPGDWATTTVWTPNGTPGSADSVTINHSVTMNTSQSVLHIAIGPSGTFTPGAGLTLNVYGDWWNVGSFVYGTSVVNFCGSTAEVVGGNATTFYKVTVNTNALATTVTQLANVTVSQAAAGALVINTGTWSTNGNNLTVSGTNASVSGNGLVTGKLDINTGGTVNIYNLDQGSTATGLGIVFVSGATTTVNISTTHVVGAYSSGSYYFHICSISSGTVNYLATGATADINLNAPTYNPSYGWYATGGTITFNGSITATYPYMYAASSAVVIFAGSANSTWTLLTFGGGPIGWRYNFNDIRIQKASGCGLTMTASAGGHINNNFPCTNLTVKPGNTLTLAYSGFSATGIGFSFTNVVDSGAIISNNNGGTVQGGDIIGVASWTGNGSFTQGATTPVPSLTLTAGGNMTAGAVTTNGVVTIPGTTGLTCGALVQNAGTITLANGSIACASLTQNAGGLSVGGNVTCAGAYSGSGSITFVGTGSDSFVATSFATNDLTVNKTSGGIAASCNPTVSHALTATAGTFALGSHALTIGSASASGSVLVNGGTFSAIGTSGSNAVVRAQASGFPYGFSALAGTIAALYCQFQYMDASGVSIASGAAVDATNNFSQCSFDHGSLTGPMLKVENSQLLNNMMNTSFSGTAGSNVEKLANSGHITIVGVGGTRWGPTYESDPNGLIDWVGLPTVNVTAPTAGVVWQVGASHNITWNSTSDVKDSLVFSTNGGSTWAFIAKDSPPHGTYAWTVTGNASTNCLVQVTAIGTAGYSASGNSATFNIIAAPTGVAVTSPAGGATWQAGINHAVTWTSTGSTKDSVIATDGASYTLLAVQTPPIGHSVSWTVAGTPGANWRVKVFALSGDTLGGVTAQSPVFNVVAAPTGVTMTAPNGGEVWEIGSHHSILWTSTDSRTDSVTFTRDGTNWLFVGKQSPPAHTLDWNVPGPACSTCKIKVSALSGDPLGGDSVRSASNFSIAAAPTVAVTSPNGGEVWLATQSYNITWTSTGSATDSIVWSADNGGTWSFVGKQTLPIAHSFAWTVPEVYGDRNLARVFAVGPGGSTVNDPSNAVFTILSPAGAWNKAADVLPGGKNKNVKDGGALAYGKEPTDANDTGYVYAFKGNNRYEFYRYNTISNAWIARDSIPAIGRSLKKKAVKKGSALIVGADSKVYGTKGNNTYDLWCYDPAKPANQHWTQLNDVPTGAKALKEGAGLAAVSISGTDYIYLLKGSGTYEFYRYKISDGSWETMANAPGGNSTKAYKNGSSITYDNNDTIWCLKGSYNELFAYSISGKDWVTKDTLPKRSPPGTKKTKVKDGSQIASDGNRTIYALKGGNTDEFWTYKCNDHTWYTATPMTAGSKKVKGGGGLVYADNYKCLYAFRGNNTLEYWAYNPGTFVSAPEPKDEGVMSSGLQNISGYKLNAAPNPFTSRTSISYSLPQAGNVALRLYDVTGKLVSTLASGYRSAGSYSSQLTANSSQPKLASGVYVLRLDSEGHTTTSKLIIE